MVAVVEERGDSLIVSNPVVLLDDPSIDTFDMTQDGQRIIANVLPTRDAPQPLTMVTNWTAVLDNN